MGDRVAIIGVGYSGFRTVTPDQSYKEMMFEAAVRAYADAGVEPKEIDSFVTVAEDFYEGTSIFDEYVPDQLGAVQRPVHTICGDGLTGLAAAHMQILTGALRIVAVESHSKASNIHSLPETIDYAADPIYWRPLEIHPYTMAGLEMARFLHQQKVDRKAAAQVVVKNRLNALKNPLASYPERISVDQVMRAEPLAEPLRSLDVAGHADGAVVFVLASEDVARAGGRRPVWIRGIGWCTDSYSPEWRDWGRAAYAEEAARMAYRQAEIDDPRSAFDLVELDDTFSYKELQHLEALGLCDSGQSGTLSLDGETTPDGRLPVNVSGGALGVGHLLDATSLARLLECCLQLRGDAGERQLADVRTALAQGWRGLPTVSGAVAILSAG